MDEVREARLLTEEAIEVAEKVNALQTLTDLHANLGVLSFLMGDIATAKGHGRQALRAARRLGRAPWDAAWPIFVLACSSTTEKDFVRAAELTGAFDGLESLIPASADWVWSPMEVQMRKDNRARLIDALGDERYERTHAIGRHLTSEEVADLALERVGPRP